MTKTSKLLTLALLATAIGAASAEAPKATPAAKTPAAKTPAPSKPADPPGRMVPPKPVPPPQDPTPAMAPMTMPKPGAETLALSPLAANITGVGKMMADAMMPGMPEMPTKSTMSCKWAIAKLWLVCGVKSTMGVGKDAMKMEGQMTVGWDFEAKEYRGTWHDNMGASAYMKGKLEGTKFMMESLGDYMMMGQPSKWRMTFDWTDPKAATLTNEAAMGKGAKWKVVEVVTLKGIKAPKPAK